MWGGGGCNIKNKNKKERGGAEEGGARFLFKEKYIKREGGWEEKEMI